MNKLTTREREILAQLCQGLPNKTIANRLGLSISTVKVHVCRVFKKLQVTNRTEALLAAQAAASELQVAGR